MMDPGADGPLPYNPYIESLYLHMDNREICEKLKSFANLDHPVETPEVEHKELVANIVYACITFVILLVLLFIAYKVYKTVRLSDPIVLCMILFLNLELLCKLVQPSHSFFVCSQVAVLHYQFIR